MFVILFIYSFLLKILFSTNRSICINKERCGAIRVRVMLAVKVFSCNDSVGCNVMDNEETPLLWALPIVTLSDTAYCLTVTACRWWHLPFCVTPNRALLLIVTLRLDHWMPYFDKHVYIHNTKPITLLSYVIYVI